MAGSTMRCGVTLAMSFCFAIGISRVSTAGSHLWRINELFSTPDGSVQFIELYECCGAAGEVNLRGIELTSDTNGSLFVFPELLEPPTTHRYLLLATEAFAALPGAPAPDYVIPASFFSLEGDLLWYGEAQNYDRFVYGPGDVPTDGIVSLQLTRFSPDEFTTAVNSPTNYAGETGSVDLRDTAFTRGDCDDDGGRNISDAVVLLDMMFSAPRAMPCYDACDANDDGELDIEDALVILFALIPESPALPLLPAECGADPSPDGLGCSSSTTCS